MYTPILPNWLAPFCCAMPFLALVGFSISSAVGATVSAPALICLTLLCGKITGWVLNVPSGFAASTRIEDNE